MDIGVGVRFTAIYIYIYIYHIFLGIHDMIRHFILKTAVVLRQLDNWTGRGGGGVAKIRACRCLTTRASNSSLFKPLLPTSLRDKLSFSIKTMCLKLTEHIWRLRGWTREDSEEQVQP